jgi:hypothetical protein
MNKICFSHIEEGFGRLFKKMDQANQEEFKFM